MDRQCLTASPVDIALAAAAASEAEGDAKEKKRWKITQATSQAKEGSAKEGHAQAEEVEDDLIKTRMAWVSISRPLGP